MKNIFQVHNLLRIPLTGGLAFGLAASLLVAGLSFTQPAWSQARMVDLGHLTLEDAKVRIRMTSATNGTMIAICEGCDLDVDTIRLKIDENSTALLNHQEITFEEAMKIKSDLQAVIYDPVEMHLFKLSIVTNL